MTNIVDRQIEGASVPGEPLSTGTHSPVLAIQQAVVWSIVGTFAMVALADWSDSYFTWYRILVIAALQVMVMTHPVLWTLRVYQTHQDFMHPIVVGSLTFVVFHILFNPIAITALGVLSIRGVLVSESSGFMSTIILSYAVIAVSWFSYCVGSSLGNYRAKIRPLEVIRPSPITAAFLVVGLGYVAVGMIGNAAMLGGASEYLEKMLHFYERSPMRELANLYGGTKWTIMQRVLPPGLMLLALGFWVYTKGSKAMLMTMLFLASLANVFLSSATGGRGMSLMIFFYSLPLFNAYVKRFTLRTLLLPSVILVGIAYILGIIRSASLYGHLNLNSLLNSITDINEIIGFTVRYLTNFIGTITLVGEVRANGVFWGETAFSGLTGLLGGQTPLTTEAEMWWRITGQDVVNNPRYGPPGELFFNFGWLGVAIGMALFGYCVGKLGKFYTNALSKRSVSDGMMIFFATLTANFLVIGNLDYFPSYFAFFSVPFYFTFWYFRNRRC